jgi:hypothetical protein
MRLIVLLVVFVEEQAAISMPTESSNAALSADVPFTPLALNTETEEGENVPACRNVVLGWSTGHVGTTTISDPRSYTNPEKYQFTFETGQMKAHQYVAGVSTEDQIKHVREVYLPMATWHNSEESDTCVDLSHANLLFIDGLIPELLRLNKTVTLVRIRRPYWETATSLMEAYHKQAVKKDECDIFGVGRMCPLQGWKPLSPRPSVALQVPSNVWSKWTRLQRVLWQIDEVEAKWHHLKADFNGTVSFREVAWSFAADDFVDHLLSPVANILGLEAVQHPDTLNENGHRFSNPPLRAHLDDVTHVPAAEAEQVQQYIDDMNSDCADFVFRDACSNITLPTSGCTSLMGDPVSVYWDHASEYTALGDPSDAEDSH